MTIKMTQYEIAGFISELTEESGNWYRADDPAMQDELGKLFDMLDEHPEEVLRHPEIYNVEV